MPYVSELGWLVKLDPQKARETILERLRAHEGNVSHAARSFDMSHRAFCKVIATLGLKRDIANLRKRLGVNWEREAPIRARRAREAGANPAAPAKTPGKRGGRRNPAKNAKP